MVRRAARPSVGRPGLWRALRVDAVRPKAAKDTAWLEAQVVRVAEAPTLWLPARSWKAARDGASPAAQRRRFQTRSYAETARSVETQIRPAGRSLGDASRPRLRTIQRRAPALRGQR